PGAEARKEAPKARKVLEINPDSPLFESLSKLNDDQEIQKFGTLLYNQALLLEGRDIEDKAGFVSLLSELMIKAAK
nr:molecular chaperone HtpG [Bacilli bacterium]